MLFPDDENAPQVIAWIERSVGSGARVTSLDGMRGYARTTTLPSYDDSTAPPVWFAEKYFVEVALDDGSTRGLVLRRYEDAQRLADDSWYVPSNESLALRLLAGTAVPAPQLQAVDLEGAVCGVPMLLESWLPGKPEWLPDDPDRYLASVAEALVAIHAVSFPSGAELARYAPYYERQHLVSLPFAKRPDLWKRVADALDTPCPAHRETFIHRDFHPGNVLCDGRKVVGVVDWLTAAWGPPGIDLGRMRLNMISFRAMLEGPHDGRAIADRFVAAYVAAGGDPSARNPYWDLREVAELVVDNCLVSDMAEVQDYVEDLLAELR